MKVLNLISFYLPAYNGGGPVFSVHNLNKWLVKRGVDVTVYTTNLNGSETMNVPLNKEVNVDGVKVWYFPSSFLKKWEYSLDFHRALAKDIDKFDLIHIGSIFRAPSALGGYYARKYKKPYVMSPRGNFMKKTFGSKSLKKKLYVSLIEGRNLAEADVIHFTGEAERNDYLAAGLPAKKTVVIPNVVDIEANDKNPAIGFRKRFSIDADKKVVLFLSRIDWVKGLDTLIPAFAKVIQRVPEAILVMAGDDDKGYKKESDKLVHKFHLDQNIIYTGVLLGNDKIKAFEESDVFVQPSYSESFGMAAAEAMRSGLPTIVTEGVGLAPQIKDEGAGLVVRKDVDELSGAIVRLLKNPELAEEIGKRGAAFIESNFSPSKIADDFIRVYNEITRT